MNIVKIHGQRLRFNVKGIQHSYNASKRLRFLRQDICIMERQKRRKGSSKMRLRRQDYGQTKRKGRIYFWWREPHKGDQATLVNSCIRGVSARKKAHDQWNISGLHRACQDSYKVLVIEGCLSQWRGMSGDDHGDYQRIKLVQHSNAGKNGLQYREHSKLDLGQWHGLKYQLLLTKETVLKNLHVCK